MPLTPSGRDELFTDDFRPVSTGGGIEEENSSRKRRAAGTAEVVGTVEDSNAKGVMGHFLVYCPPNGQPTTARDELFRLTQMCKTQSQQVDQLRQLQYQALQTLQPEALSQLQSNVPSMCHQLRQEIQLTESLLDRYLLDPIELFQVQFLLQQFGMLAAHANALHQELSWAQSGRATNDQGQLPFIGQVFYRECPKFAMLLKGRKFEQPFVMEVISGVTANIAFASSMRCEAVKDEDVPDRKFMADNEVMVEAQTKIATFSALKAAASTRMNFVTLQFGTQVRVGGTAPQVVHSEPSTPLIVISHESQWVEAETKLSMAQSFGRHAKSVSWQKFANVVHLRFLRVSKQDLKAVHRKLTLSDFSYFYDRFFGTTMVNLMQASKFYAWFIPAMQRICFKRHVRPMWVSGLIFGFIDKQKCNRTLADFAEGTFLLRFSESSPGLFAIAYVSDDLHDRVKHYLVKADDIRELTLADFIRGKPQWIHLLRVDPKTSQLSRSHKEEVLSRFFSDASLPKKSGGYTLL